MRNNPIILFLALTSSLVFSITSSRATEKEPAKTWREVASGTQSGIKKSTRQAIQSQEQWLTWWKSHAHFHLSQENTETPKPPTIDFNKETVLVATMGMHSTGGYRIHFSQIQREGKSLKVTIESASPAPDAMVTMVLTSPFAVVAIPKHDGTIEFIDKRK